MTDIHIPPEVEDAGARAIDARVSEPGQCSYHDMARAAFLAMIEAWPNMQQRIHIEQAIILPLTEQNND